MQLDILKQKLSDFIDFLKDDRSNNIFRKIVIVIMFAVTAMLFFEVDIFEKCVIVIILLSILLSYLKIIEISHKIENIEKKIN